MTAEEIRDACLEFLDQHRQVCDKEHCMERFNLMAFLCHCVGIRPSDCNQLARDIREVDSMCPDCEHHQN